MQLQGWAGWVGVLVLAAAPVAHAQGAQDQGAQDPGTPVPDTATPSTHEAVAGQSADTGEIHLASAEERNNTTGVDYARFPGETSNILSQWPEPDHVFGQWGGIRSKLRDAGVSYTLNYTAEMVYNVDGGIDTGFAYAHQVQLGFDFDWQKISGVNGLATHIIFINREGRNASEHYVGDTVIQAQEIYGAGFGVAAKLVWFYAEENLLNNKLNIAFGRVAPGMDFNASPLFCNFMTLTICGHDRALTADQGFEDWPMSVWGARVRYWPTEHTYVMVGGYQSQPFPVLGQEYFTQGGHTGWSWTTAGTTGASIPVEFAWLPRFGENQLRGHYKIGFNWDTSRYPDNYFDINGQPLVLSGQPARLHQGRGQFWVTGNQMLERHGPNPGDGLFVLVTYVHDQSDTTLFRNFIWAGFLDKGFWADRPNDQIGFGFTYYDVSPRLHATQLLQAQQDLPFAGGARGIQDHAMVLEANYAITPWRGVLLQPELEYFIRPGATDAVANAFLVGLKVDVDF